MRDWLSEDEFYRRMPTPVILPLFSTANLPSSWSLSKGSTQIAFFSLIATVVTFGWLSWFSEKVFISQLAGSLMLDMLSMQPGVLNVPDKITILSFGIKGSSAIQKMSAIM